ncbi:hypothetical protein PENSPDRAFT_650938 [Peniophora sp. CONT]|nr:hypothetical protein PENSPDRAFT_650938 [Peniophora sp. CONT]
MQSPLPRNEDGLLYRCSYRPGDTDVVQPYVLEEDPEEDENGLRTYSLHDPDLHFQVDHSVIHILASDANPGNNVPGPHTIVGRDGETVHSEVIPFPDGDIPREEWLQTLGEYIAAVMFGRLPNESERPFVLANFPDNMAFYLLEKTRSDGRRRTEVYLRSHETQAFATANEFARHSMWLMDGMPQSVQRTACLCKYCDHVVGGAPAPQNPITRDLLILSGQH